MHRKHNHCSYCGEKFLADQAWPRGCGRCRQISYLNPLPVAIAVLPVDDGVLCIRRSIEPRSGWLALPGGFLEVGETWQAGCARELFEETGVVVSPEEITVHAVHSTPPPDPILMLFGRARPRTWRELPAFVPNSEVSEMVVLRGPEELAFPLHTQVLREVLGEGALSGAGRRGGRRAAQA